MQKLLAPAIVVAALMAISAPAQAAPFNCNLPSFQRHRALFNASNAIAAAYNSGGVAQENNNYNLGGHAGAARAALQNAYNEMLAAARAAN